MCTSPLDIYEVREQIRRHISRQDCYRACRVSRTWYQWFNPSVWRQLTPYRADKHPLSSFGQHVRVLSIDMPPVYAGKGQWQQPQQQEQLQPSASLPPRFARNIFQYCQSLERLEIRIELDHDNLSRLSTFLNDLVPVSRSATAFTTITPTVGSAHIEPRQEDSRSHATVNDNWLSPSCTTSLRSLTLQFTDFSAKAVLVWLLKAHRRGHFTQLQDLTFRSNIFAPETMPLFEEALIKVTRRFKFLKRIQLAKRVRHIRQGSMLCSPSPIHARLFESGEDEDEDEDGNIDDTNDMEGIHEDNDHQGYMDGGQSSSTYVHPSSLESLFLDPLALSSDTSRMLFQRLSNLTHFRVHEQPQPSVIDALAAHCHALQWLQIGMHDGYSRVQDVFSASLAVLFRSTPTLSHVQINSKVDGAVVLPALLDRCHSLETVVMPFLNTSDARPQDVGRMFCAWPKLKLLEIGLLPEVSALDAFQQCVDMQSAVAPNFTAPNQTPPLSTPVGRLAGQTLRTLRLKGIQVLSHQEVLALRLLLNNLPALCEFSISAGRIHQGIFFDDLDVLEGKEAKVEQEKTGARQSEDSCFAPHWNQTCKWSVLPYSPPPSPPDHSNHWLQHHNHSWRLPTLFCPSLVEISTHALFLAPANVKQVQLFLQCMPSLQSMNCFTLDGKAQEYLQRYHPSLIPEYD